MEKRACVLLKVNGRRVPSKKGMVERLSARSLVLQATADWPLASVELGHLTLQNQSSESSAQSHEAEMERIQE